MKFQPMLSGVLDLDRLKFPVYASVKLDGIRAIKKDGVLLSRNLKPIPNRYTQERFAQLPDGFDGELIVGEAGAPDVWNVTQSGVMSVDGMPDVQFWAFDDFSEPLRPFVHRLETIHHRIAHETMRCPVRAVHQENINSFAKLMEYEEYALAGGFEGLMLRDPIAPYKFGRSTVREGYLLKMKRFFDAEAEIIGIVERQHNTNEQERDERGYAKRSKAKAGLVGAGMVGALVCSTIEHAGKLSRTPPPRGKAGNVIEFEIGSGMDDATRLAFWKDSPVGKVVKFKYQKLSPDKKPLFPVFLGLRDERDMS